MIQTRDDESRGLAAISRIDAQRRRSSRRPAPERHPVGQNRPVSGVPRRPTTALARELSLAGQTPSPIIASLAFLATAIEAQRGLTPAIVFGVIYFLVGYPTLRAGVERLDDPDHGQRVAIGSIVALTNGPLLVAIAATGPLPGTVATLGAVVAAILSSAPSFRMMERPLADATTYGVLLVLPAIAGSLVGGSAPIDLPWPVLVAFFAWASACAAIEALAVVDPDRAGGRTSVAIRFGTKRTAVGALVGFTLAALIGFAIGGLAALAGLGLTLYVLLPLAILSRPEARQARRAARSLAGLHRTVGVLIAAVLLVHWGLIRATPGQALGAAAIAVPMVCLGQLLVTDRLLRLSRQRALERAETVQPRLPRLSVLVRADPGAALEPLIGEVAAQDHPDTELIIVVDERLRDEIAIVEAALAAARPWSADRDRVVVAPTAPDGRSEVAQVAIGLEASSGDHVLVLGHGTVLVAGALRQLHEIALASKAGLVSGIPAYAMPTIEEQAFVPGFPMTLLGLMPVWATVSTRGRHHRLAFAHSAFLLIERDAYDASEPIGSTSRPARLAIDLARTIAKAGRRVRLVDAVEIVRTRPHPDGWGALREWRRSGLAYTGDSFAGLIDAILAAFGAWVLPWLAPLLGLVLGDRELLAGGLIALAVLAAFRIALALLQAQPLGVIVLHPVTAVATLLALIASLADGVAGDGIRGDGIRDEPASPGSTIQAEPT
jgi:4-hydroxybenzoate polyprenyltransferase